MTKIHKLVNDETLASMKDLQSKVRDEKPKKPARRVRVNPTKEAKNES